MEYARLGRNGPLVSRIAFGCEPLGGQDWGEVDEREAIQAVRTALEKLNAEFGTIVEKGHNIQVRLGDRDGHFVVPLLNAEVASETAAAGYLGHARPGLLKQLRVGRMALVVYLSGYLTIDAV